MLQQLEVQDQLAPQQFKASNGSKAGCQVVATQDFKLEVSDFEAFWLDSRRNTPPSAGIWGRSGAAQLALYSDVDVMCDYDVYSNLVCSMSVCILRDICHAT